MTIDRAKFMQDAWAIVRKANVARFSLRFILGNALRTVWADVRRALSAARRAAALALEAPAVRVILDEIRTIESGADFLTIRDKERLAALREALRMAA